jgi:hypothetical protein
MTVVLLDIEVVARGDMVNAQSISNFKKYVPLDQGVTTSAGRWCKALAIAVDEVVDNLRAESVVCVNRDPFDAQLPRFAFSLRQ